MMGSRRLRQVYKEVRFQQLRSFCATARLGSLSAAAQALGVAQPTVWAQVHALERELGTALVEPHGRGCRLTEAGRLLAELALPLVTSLDSLPRIFSERIGQTVARLTVAASQRILVEDLPEVIADFERRYPQVRLSLVECLSGQVAEAVDRGEADLGLSTESATEPLRSRLVFTPAYSLDMLLVTPLDHPLARRSRITLRDLRGYPLVNAASGFPRPDMAATLERAGVLFAAPQRIQAVNTPVIRRYVEMGFGIGIVVGRPGRKKSPTLHERSLNRYFGPATVHLIWRKGGDLLPHVRTFAHTVQTVLNSPPA
ncbi:MAG: LysR substrate-binding domain-containing protein [Thermogemmata sp.]|uniref:LysR family transcriptional regulator n=1 Tax=Thermogemmata fonticola TaxID=2755323 RepID=A0A7V8VBD9_9BACT|nr:LysR substrate-binding domain-containing protein [Thermogemmata fonticola]MBA2224938.1 LysR family transcriptional regulator [Thermogemmata fonticola]GIW84105.1 MAG: transcriptional regulator CysB [Gemmataceae bacterium]